LVGDLALQWVMASRIENRRVRDWLGNHPDTVLEALRHCCGEAEADAAEAVEPFRRTLGSHNFATSAAS